LAEKHFGGVLSASAISASASSLLETADDELFFTCQADNKIAVLKSRRDDVIGIAR
jgi:hypothetical protein